MDGKWSYATDLSLASFLILASFAAVWIGISVAAFLTAPWWVGVVFLVNGAIPLQAAFGLGSL